MNLRLLTTKTIAFLVFASSASLQSVKAFTIITQQPPWGICINRSSSSPSLSPATSRSSRRSIEQEKRRQRRPPTFALFGSNPLRPVPPDQEGVPIPFVDQQGQNFIECYADSIAEVDGVEYTIGVPCDYAVALCYFREDQQLIPIELNDPLMDDVYPIAESIVEEEFGDELVLQRTPQTLTLVGELEEDDDEEDGEFDLDEDDEDDMDDDDDGDEEVEVLLSFEQDNRQYNLVRMLDPMLLVGKQDTEQPQNRLLLTPEESDKVMPVLEEMFLEFREERDDLAP